MKKPISREEYYKLLKKKPEGKCLFCDKDFQLVIKEFDHWLWVKNLSPYWDFYTVIIPKRHFEKYSDMTFKEAGELVRVIDYVEKKIIDSRIEIDNKKVQQVVLFWRTRFDRFDETTGTIRPSHFHINYGPDKDGRWNSTIDKNAYKHDIADYL